MLYGILGYGTSSSSLITDSLTGAVATGGGVRDENLNLPVLLDVNIVEIQLNAILKCRGKNIMAESTGGIVVRKMECNIIMRLRNKASVFLHLNLSMIEYIYILHHQ